MTTLGIIFLTVVIMLFLGSYIYIWKKIIKLENGLKNACEIIGEDTKHKFIKSHYNGYTYCRYNDETILDRIARLENSWTYRRCYPRSDAGLSERVDSIAEDVCGMDNRMDELESRIEDLELVNENEDPQK